MERNLQERPPGIESHAMANLLKYLQVSMVIKYQRIAEHLYFNLRRGKGFDHLKLIQQLEGNLMQPRESGSIEDYVHDAERAQIHLVKLVEEVVSAGNHKLKVVSSGIKSLESITRKVNSNYIGGDVRKVNDIARISVVCDTPDGLAYVFKELNGRVQVRSTR